MKCFCGDSLSEDVSVTSDSCGEFCDGSTKNLPCGSNVNSTFSLYDTGKYLLYPQ